jgi:hypothetical protein
MVNNCQYKSRKNAKQQGYTREVKGKRGAQLITLALPVFGLGRAAAAACLSETIGSDHERGCHHESEPGNDLWFAPEAAHLSRVRCREGALSRSERLEWNKASSDTKFEVEEWLMIWY